MAFRTQRFNATFTMAHQLSRSSVEFWGPVNGFYSLRFLASLQTPKLEGHSWSVVHDCLLNIFSANLHIWRPSPRSATRGDIPWYGDMKPRMECYHTSNLIIWSLELGDSMYWPHITLELAGWSFTFVYGQGDVRTAVGWQALVLNVLLYH